MGTQISTRINSAADVSSVAIDTSTLGQQAWLNKTGFSPYAVCRGIDAKTIIAAAITAPAVRLSELRTEYFNGDGTAKAASVVDVSRITGTVDTTGGGITFTATENLENAGVKVGDSIIIDPTGIFPPPQIRTITRLVGAIFDVDTAVTDVGLVAYRVGPDLRGVPAGTRVIVGSAVAPLNAGPYRVVSGSIGQLTLNRAFFTTNSPVSITVYSSFLQAQATGATPADGITANPASAGATAVGYTVTATQVKAGLTHFSVSGTIDFLARGVGVGDILRLLTSPAATEVSITQVLMSELLSAPVPYFSGSVGFTVKSARYTAWLSLVSTITTFLNTVDLDAADFAITRLVSGAAPTTAQLTPIVAFQSAITSLANIGLYVVPFERTVDNILRMLTEQGMDRAVDLFTTLQIVEFFSMHPDGSSYSTNLIRTAADVARQVAPVSRFAQSIINSPEVRLRSRRLST